MKQVMKYFSIGLTVALALSSCSDKFLEDKKNYDNAQSDIYNYYSGANARLADLYSWCLPSVGDVAWNNPSMGSNDMCAKATEEYTGLSDLVDPEITLVSNSQTNSVPDFFQQQQNNIQASVYGRIRNVNDCIEGITASTLTDEEKNELLGQAYFLRAWCYYNLFKWYGGVPLVKKTSDPVAENVTPRSSSKETMDFILEDLATAIEMLGSTKMDKTNYGRVTSGTAMALRGRVLLLWATPLFNRANDRTRWTTAYETMKADLDGIDACGYGLYTSNSSGAVGGAFAEQFLAKESKEAIFFTLHNQVANDDGLDIQKNNTWERSIRPSNTGGSGKTASAYLLNLFPMEDGRRPNNLADNNVNGVDNYTKLEVSSKAYNPEFPFVDRDPRFYHTFGLPGFRWAYSGAPKDERSPQDGPNYTLWNYVWYVDKDDEGNIDSGNSYGADNLFSSKSGVYVRKKSDDLDINTAPLYTYMATYTKGAAPFFSAAPLIEIRYAEVLLNLAEVACMAGHMDEAVDYLKQIRARAGYTADNNYGLQANLASDEATCMSAILYERQIEFAYEGKRFDDMRSWLLFDGGVNFSTIPGAPESWKLTGFDGNTCTWLGVAPLNGQARHNIEFRTANKHGLGGKTQEAESDPLVKAGVTRPEGVDLRKVDEFDAQLSTLQKWYADNLTWQRKRGDGYYQTGDNVGSDKVVSFKPKYYFFGLSSGAQTGNKALPQTIGWEATFNEATFDPLSVTPTATE